MISKYIKDQTGIELTEAMQKQLQTYCAYLQEENEKYNLTAITDTADVYIKHFADSMLGSVAIPLNATLCDIGCGAGFPSIPLKILRPDIDITLVDSTEKKVNFTKSLCNQLNIFANFYHMRAEDFAVNHREKYDVATARAVAPLPVLLEYTAQTVKVGGTILAYKTDESELDEAQNACKVLNLKFNKSYYFKLEDGSNRCLLTFIKTGSTPAKYPRGQNKPRKQPL